MSVQAPGNQAAGNHPAGPAADTDAAAGAAADPSYDPRTGERLGSVPHTAAAELGRILDQAASAAPAVAAASPAERRDWISAVVLELAGHADELVELAGQETALGADRLRGELAKAGDSARFYADTAVEGSYLAASCERVDAATTLARWNIPVGPVAVFGASNFPFGFGVFGHDVASALSAGCPVIAKAHPAHPRLSVRLAELVRAGLRRGGAPHGTYDLVVGFDAGLALIDAEPVRAVAFTGSQAGGMALLQRAAVRGVPVFAEMGTVNPVVVTPAAAACAAELAQGFVGSFTLGGGQFCTKPGLLLVPAGSGIAGLAEAAVAAVDRSALLTAGIASHFHRGVQDLSDAAGTPAPVPSGAQTTSGPAGESNAAAARARPAAGSAVTPQLLRTTPDQLQPGSRLLEECFGPVALICEYDDVATALAVLSRLQPSLAASVFTGPAAAPPSGAADGDGPAHIADPDADRFIDVLLPRVGRVALNAWPTGVANSYSQQHGGPWPATSRPEATSVGAGALDRFVRPVSLQNAAAELLPPPVRADNPWRIPQRVDGSRTPIAH